MAPAGREHAAFAGSEIQRMHTIGERDDGAAVFTNRHRADDVGHRPSPGFTRCGVQAVNGFFKDIDPVQLLALHVPHGTFAYRTLRHSQPGDLHTVVPLLYFFCIFLSSPRKLVCAVIGLPARKP
jgi:hypothetical protein